MPRNIQPRKPPQRVRAEAAPGEEELAAAEADASPPAPAAAAPEVPPPAAAEVASRPSRGVAPASYDHKGGTASMGAARKLTKKQQVSLEQWKGANAVRTVAASVQALVARSRTKFGHSAVMVGREADVLLIGIPCPSLAFEFLIQQDCFPLGVVMHLIGEPGCNKSALLYEFFRWVDALGGYSVLNENETKFSPDLCASIMGRRSMEETSVVLHRCQSVEDWQDRTTFTIDELKGILEGTKESPGPGRTLPILIGTDSIMGKLAQENIEKVDSAGHLGRSFAVEALSITNYMKAVPQKVDGWPFSLVLVNHLKPRKDDMGRDVKGVAGGRGVEFQSSFVVESSVVKKNLECADFDGTRLRLKCLKNSFGITGRQVQTRMLFWDEDDPETGASVQRTVWDWDWSTVHLLSTVSGRPQARLKEAGFHIATPKVSDVENLAWSKSLGMTEDDARPWHQVGAMIRQNPEVLALVRRALGIKHRPWLQGDYLEQLEALRRGEA